MGLLVQTVRTLFLSFFVVNFPSQTLLSLLEACFSIDHTGSPANVLDLLHILHIFQVFDPRHSSSQPVSPSILSAPPIMDHVMILLNQETIIFPQNAFPHHPPPCRQFYPRLGWHLHTQGQRRPSRTWLQPRTQKYLRLQEAKCHRQ